MPDTAQPRSAIAPVLMTRFGSDFEGFSQDLGRSFERYGFAVIGEHGLDQGMLEESLSQTKAFFALPEESKRRYHIPGTGGARGYTPFGIETAKGAKLHDLKEFWHAGRDLPEGHPYRKYMADNVWPSEVPGFQPAISAQFQALDQMGLKVLRAIARYLGLEDGFFEPTVRYGNSILRLLHYPPVGADSPHVRAGAHEDINVITLLLGAEEAGLELLDRDGQWLPIAPPPGSIVINIGDMLQRLTNHRLPSTTHRVVNPAPERRGFPRYSTPYFLHFEPEYLIRTLPNCVDEAHPDRYPEPITAEDYLQERLREIKLK